MSLPEWIFLPTRKPEQLKKASRQLHFASQYLAAAGQSFLSHQSDDSHTNMGWSWERGLISHPLQLDQTYQILVNYPHFRLDVLLENGGIVKSWFLHNKKFSKLHQEMRELFAERQSPDQPPYKPIDHYDLPDPQLKQFKKPSLRMLETLTDYRQNAQIILESLVEAHDSTAAVRTWPHHFDTGALFTVEKDDSGAATKTIGLGLAIPDSLSDTHYFYINHWSNTGDIDYDELPDLPKGGQWHQGDQAMAILPMAKVLKQKTASAQEELVRQFFQEGIAATEELIEAAIAT